MNCDEIDVLIYVHDADEVVRGMGRNSRDLNFEAEVAPAGHLERRRIRVADLTDKLREATAAVDAVSSVVRGTSLALEEVQISLEIETSGALGWVFGKASGGLSFTFKVTR
jgi:hypothetical protein